MCAAVLHRVADLDEQRASDHHARDGHDDRHGAGRSCNAGKRFIVAQHLYEPVEQVAARMADQTTG